MVDSRFTALGGSFINYGPPPFLLACDPEFFKKLTGGKLLNCIPGINDPVNFIFCLDHFYIK